MGSLKVAVLFSGGKDSCFACYKAMQTDEVVCLVTVVSRNPESYMFHTPNIHLAEVQAQAIGLPLLAFETEGRKEEELKDLERAVETAKEKHGIEGVATGAIRSAYQATRVQRICDSAGLQCLSPLWQVDEARYVKEFISSGFKALISGVFAYPLDASWLGRTLDEKTLQDLIRLSERFGISVAGEGGEFETFVYDGPIFKKKIEILEASKVYENCSGIYKIHKVRLADK